MNKYQREKAKRIKRMSKLCIGYGKQKSILRLKNFEQIDKIIEEIDTFENSPLYKNLKIIFEKLGNTIYETFEKVRENYVK